MVDLLVRLYSLPVISPLLGALREGGIIIRKAHPSETDLIVPWVSRHFNQKWAQECKGALGNRPPTCFIAVRLMPASELDDSAYNLPPEKLVGFACYDIVARGMFGPEGVHPDFRSQGIGKALLLSCMHAMADDGYAYAVIAWAGPIDFYEKVLGATQIEGSEPGIFRGPLVE
jgi:ribosomal protein S18 acetylase RimI-like enzyme